MSEEYIRTLRQQLKRFSLAEQDELLEEISSHIESGEEDPKIGKDREERRRNVIHELGSPKDLGGSFQELYHPNRLIDFLWILIPYFFYPYLNSFYGNLMPRYSWADVRLDVLIHLPLIAIGLWRRSVPLTLFWLTIVVSQLFTITLKMHAYYGMQTGTWAVLLLALLTLAGYLIWKQRSDLLIVGFGLMPLALCILGSILSMFQPTDYSFGPLGQSLLLAHSYVTSMVFYALMLAMAFFFLPANRAVRWLALLMYALIIGLDQSYLDNVFAEWVFYVWILLPLTIVIFAWWLEQYRKRMLQFATL